MLALEIRVNGELRAICGDAALDFLSVWIKAARNGASAAQDFDLTIQCQGHRKVDAELDEVLKWVHARVKLGDEFSIRFVDVDRTHQPIDRQTYPRPVPPDA